MINLAVIDLKDIIKYLVRITLIIVIVVGLTKYFSNLKTKLNVDKSSFLACLDTVIPSIKNVNKKEESVKSSSDLKPLKMALEVELGMIDSIEKDGTGEESNNENENSVGEISNENTENSQDIQEAQTGLTTEVLKNNVPEKYIDLSYSLM